MKAVFQKELGQLFHSVIGYIYLAVFLLIGGCYFLVYNLLQANGDIRNFFSPMMSTVIFLLPMLTMRSYAEERRMHTDRTGQFPFSGTGEVFRDSHHLFNRSGLYAVLPAGTRCPGPV